MAVELMKLEVELEACCLCGSNSGDLQTPEEHDAGALPGQTPLRMMLLHLNNNKVVPEGGLCSTCIQRTLEAYEFSTSLSVRSVPPLSEKIRALRRKLHELTQKIDVFIVVGGSNVGTGGSYNEEDIIMVDKAALAAAAKADDEELERARNARGDTVYQCSVCPASFQRVSEYRTHVASHGGEAFHACWTCGAQFTSRAALKDHSLAHADTADNTCYLCGISFQRVSELRAHELSCESRCPLCALLCDSRAQLARHVAAQHAGAGAGAGAGGVACAACFRTFADGELLAAHLLRHRQAKQFVCGYDSCILRFATRQSLVSHIRKCHSVEIEPATESMDPTKCTVCSRTFGSVAAMKRHSRVHRNDETQVHKETNTVEEEGGEVEYLEVETLEDLDYKEE